MDKLVFTQTDEGIVVTGKTYDVKDVLKSAGASWEPISSGWIFRGKRDLEELLGSIREDVLAATLATKSRAQAEKDHRKWLKTPEGKKYLVQQALQQGVYWICCEDCEVVDWSRQTTNCQKHSEGGNAFRVRGCIYTGD